MLHQFSEESPEKTLAMLQAVIPRIKGGQSREIVERTAEKFMLFSEKSCVELTETTRRRFRQENERSIRTRLARAKEKSENQYGEKRIKPGIERIIFYDDQEAAPNELEQTKDNHFEKYIQR